ncbi:MAG: WYL domain-containing protein [Bacteroidales bacterium]|nr:WYL domain-containing protein [Bacteroidales bacterium]
MTPTSLFNRYIWLVELLSYSKGLSKKEIDLRWRNSGINDDPECKEIPRRTFIRMKEAIYSMFDISIQYDRTKDKYYIEESDTDRNKNTRDFLLSAFAVNRLVSENRDLSDRILLEETSPLGNYFLPEITAAMRENHRIGIVYQSFEMQTAREFEIEPYALRYFGRRWYVLARTDFHDQLYLYALDRMKAVKLTGVAFKLPADFSAQSHFSRYYGMLLTGHDVETILLRTNSTRAKYLRSLPLHHSQKEIFPQHFQLRLVATPDFIGVLRSMGTEVEVLEPLWLRKELLKETKKMVEKYSRSYKKYW